jgi:glycosyltransferase involved in cell wall biosynthesis
LNNYDDKNKPLVSVITGYYNRKKNLEESIDSIFNQSYDNIEFIVFDDFSSDGTREILKEIKKPNFILIQHKHNIGFTQGLINAIHQSSGKYIAIHGAGDISYKDRVRKQVEVLENDENSGIVGCYSERVNVFDNEVKVYAPEVINNKTSFIHGEIMFRKDLYDLVGGYDPYMVYNQCSGLVRKIGKISDIKVVEEVLYKQFFYEDGVAKNTKKQFSQKVYSNIGSQIKELSGSDVREVLYLCGVNNKQAIKKAYVSSLVRFGEVSLDERFENIIRKKYKFFYFLYSSPLNTSKFRYLHLTLFPVQIIFILIKKVTAQKL